MILQRKHQALFAAFDVYPSAKGAATHIYHNAQTLFNTFQGGWLSVLGNEKLSPYQYEEEDNIEITRFIEEIPNFLHRTQIYGAYFSELLINQKELQLAHFRDVWNGLPILQHKKKAKLGFKTVYEVNAFLSIELPYRHPFIAPRTLKKVKEMESYCHQQADYIITPSEVIKQNLIHQGIQEEKITVITNGAEVPETLERPTDAPEQYIIYFGALQPWQGMDILLKSLHYLADFPDLKLVICSSTKPRYSKIYRKLSEKLDLEDRVIWKYQLPKKELYEWVHYALLSVAPLTESSRNLEQGCCPLKVLESMALTTPVVASDIPAVREIISSQEFGKLVRPGRPAELARGIRLLLDLPEASQEMAKLAKEHIISNFTWKQKKQELKDFYERIMG